jgi:hypothetical protein
MSRISELTESARLELLRQRASASELTVEEILDLLYQVHIKPRLDGMVSEQLDFEKAVLQALNKHGLKQ